MPADAIDTRTAEHRILRFRGFPEMWADVEKIAAAERAGRLRRTGNWTAGQIFNHLATWIEYANDGFPSTLRPPWIIRLIVRLRKSRYLNQGMPHGVKIPGIPGGTLGIEDAGLDAGLQRLRRAWDKLLAATPTHPSPIFGHMTHDDWIKSNLRHAELHLGFLHP